MYANTGVDHQVSDIFVLISNKIYCKANGESFTDEKNLYTNLAQKMLEKRKKQRNALKQRIRGHYSHVSLFCSFISLRAFLSAEHVNFNSIVFQFGSVCSRFNTHKAQIHSTKSCYCQTFNIVFVNRSFSDYDFLTLSQQHTSKTGTLQHCSCFLFCIC